MIEWLTGYLPQALSGWEVALLLATAVFTAFLTASVGVGGGVFLLAVLSLVMPVAAIIPVHGLVQFGANANRALMLWRDISWRSTLWFLPGALLGAWLASLFLVQLPLPVLQLAIAAFILYLCWGPKLPPLMLGDRGTLVAGALTTFLSHFVGATGPLVAAFIKQKHADRRQTSVATFAATMVLQHGPKAVVYGATGFVFGEWLLLVGLMIAAGAVGTKLGLLQLARLTDRRFTRLFNTVLTLLCLRLLWQAGSGLLAG
ncbi:MAG: sulfite exporter TauE/SafE family protein [Thiopseudomonas sp.]